MQRPLKLMVCLLAFAMFLSRPSLGDEPSEEQKTQLYAGVAELQGGLDLARESGQTAEADIAVFAKAIDWMLRHEEFGRKQAVKNAFQVLDWGRSRASQIGESRFSAGRHVLGYRSRLDDSVQPYAVTLPRNWNNSQQANWPLHVVLHGRADDMNEVAFIAQHEGKSADREADWIQLDVYGRGNNAYRWAGEADVFEALADVTRRFPIDERRITLWGFSMGGAGAWHLGLHHPDRWSSVGAGAGFVDLYHYQKKLTPLIDYQDKTLRIYDAIPYALNLADVPFITYGGEKDSQLAASQLMAEEAGKLNVPLKALVGANMGHKFDDKSLREFMAFHAAATREGRPEPPGRRDLRFVTYTLKYNRCDWLQIEELITPYERTTVESKVEESRLNLKTANVRALRISNEAAKAVSLDGSDPLPLTDPPGDSLFVRDGDTWTLLGPEEASRFAENPDRHKRPDLQGPIDDAFTQPFICVRGTSGPWSDAQAEWSNWSLKRFEREWDKWFRGRPRVIDDSALTDAEIADSNLILFGDPGSNSVLRRIIDQLPLTWSESEIIVAGQKFDAATHGVALIYPNPLNPNRYVVVNSGMTFHEAEFRSSNAQIYPRLGDIAVLQLTAGKDGTFTEKAVWAALFDSNWKLSDAKSKRG